MAGIRAFQQTGLPVSLSAVVLRSTLHGLPYLCQIADVLDAGKLKLILPLRKGNALGLAKREFITVEEARDAFGRLTELRGIHDWRPAVRMTPWTAETEGHMIVIEPNGSAQAWPVYDRPDLFLPLGNLLEEPITAIWDRYPYKANHYAKYLGASIYTAARSRRVMRTWTNLAWPDDPYRTGQQLYRKPAGRLAAFTTWPAVIGGQQMPATTAIVYLPLHRTEPVTVTGQTLAFGFRAVSAADPAEVPAVAAVADLDLMQARRHAAVLTGYHLDQDLAALQQADGVTAWRGLAAVADDWADRSPAPGRAALFDCDLDLPGGLPLGRACQQAGISPMATGRRRPGTRAATRRRWRWSGHW